MKKEIGVDIDDVLCAYQTIDPEKSVSNPRELAWGVQMMTV